MDPQARDQQTATAARATDQVLLPAVNNPPLFVLPAVLPPLPLDLSMPPPPASAHTSSPVPPGFTDDPITASLAHAPGVRSGLDLLRESSLQERAPGPGMISDFPSSRATLFANDHPLSADLSTTRSSPNATPASSVASHVSSPAVHARAGAYTASLSSSLSSALGDSRLVGRTRSDSSASPVPLTSTGSEVAFSPDSSVQYQSPSQDGDSMDSQNDAHLLAVSSILNNIVSSAKSAQQACTAGQGNLALVRIDELKRAISVVSTLIANTHLDDGPLEPSPPPAAPVPTNHVSAGPPHTMTTPVFTTAHPSPTRNGSLHDMQSLDALGDSRKRCASTQSGDRVMKAIKLEPQDPILHLTNSSALSTPSVAPPGDIYPFPDLAPAGSLTSSLVDPAIPSFIPTDSSQAIDLHSLGISSMQQVDYSPPTSSGPTPTNVAPSAYTWSDRPPALQHRHTLSGGSASMNGVINGSLNGYHLGMPTASGAPLPPFTSAGSFGSPPKVGAAHSVNGATHNGSALNGSALPQPLSRPSRSLSVSSAMPQSGTFAYGLPDMPLVDVSEHGLYKMAQYSPSGSSVELDDSEGTSPTPSQTQSPTRGRSDSRGDLNGMATSRPGTSGCTRAIAENGSAGGHGNEVPQEYRAEVDRIFFAFLGKICSDLDATDSKGEPIHQTLMAKKMQRLDESPDFRPFKFRIQAFTNAFLEELARAGYPEEIIPMKRIRNYLWNQSYISRFNEEGKKTKSKGNHIWSIDAKKMPDGGWSFRPFRRRLAGSPPNIAYAGLRWSWTPRIWDPQSSRPNLPVKYSSPSLPLWLSWNDDVLSGVPPPDAKSCEVTVEARYMQDGQEEVLSHTVQVNIAPMNNMDPSFASMRRPSLSSLSGDMADPRRIASDSLVQQANAPRPMMRTQSSLGSSLVTAPTQQEAQVVQVLQTAADRVEQEAQNQVVAAGPFCEPEFKASAKQLSVVRLAARAVEENSYHNPSGPAQSVAMNAVATAATNMVMAAADVAIADKQAVVAGQLAAGIISSPATAAPITVNDVSVAAQSAVAHAVNMVGPLAPEVDVLMTANSILLQKQPPAPVPLGVNSQVPVDNRAHANGNGNSLGQHSMAPPMHYPMSAVSLSGYGPGP